MLKKILVGLLILVVLLVGALIALPVIFKDDLIAIAKKEANKNLNAEVDFGEFDLSIFKSFPDFTFTISNVSVINKAPFEGVTLANIESLEISLDLMSVINGETIKINSFGLTKPALHVLVMPDGKANYDIALAGDSTDVEVEEETTSDESTAFSAAVNQYYIRNAHIIYDDQQGDMYAELVNFTHEGSGDFTQDDFLLKTLTSCDALTYEMEGIKYMNKTELDMKLDINMNMPNMKFAFDENSLRLNQLELRFDGWLAMPAEEGDPIDLDMSFSTNQTDFKSILSMVPAVYLTDFEGVETAGNFSLSGMAKGRMVGDALPAFDVKLKVDNAMFHYPDLPKSAENIAIDLRAQNPGGSDDNTIIDINKFHVELAGNPIDMTLHMRTPMSDPFMDAALNADIDLASIKDVIPLEEGQSLTGKVFSDITIKEIKVLWMKSATKIFMRVEC